MTDDPCLLQELNNKLTEKPRLVLLAVGVKRKKKESAQTTSCTVYRPNTGQQAKRESFLEIRKKFDRTDYDTARYHWEKLHDESAMKCLHAYT